ncbi:MAG: type II toxin-antitoxin system VapC family toxin [Acidobacteriota bacterium]
MTYLLDSNVVLWMLGEPQKLTPAVLRLLEDGGNSLVVSTASVWELSIKVAKGKLALPGGSVRELLEQLDLLGVALLPVGREHILRTEVLPHLHGDPFDRMIVAQAMVEKLPILSSDPMLARYGATVLWN